MKMSAAGRAALIKREGVRLKAYKDSVGVWTIGVGSTYNFDKGRKVKKGDFITKETAVKWLQKEDEQIIQQLNFYIKKPLNPDQSAAIVDYTYNRGIGNLLKTQLDELINSNPDDPRILKEIEGTGLKDRLGHILFGLKRRRLAESYLYKTGQLKFNWPRI